MIEVNTVKLRGYFSSSYVSKRVYITHSEKKCCLKRAKVNVGKGEFKYLLYVFSGMSTAGAHRASMWTVKHSQKPQIIMGVMCALAPRGDLLNLSKYSWMSAVNVSS